MVRIDGERELGTKCGSWLTRRTNLQVILKSMRARDLIGKFVGQTVMKRRRGVSLACRVSFPQIDNRDWMHLFLQEQCLGSVTHYGHSGTAIMGRYENVWTWYVSICLHVCLCPKQVEKKI